MLSFPSSGSGRPYINLDARTGMWRISHPDGPQMTDLSGRTLGVDIANAVQGWLHVGTAGADWKPIEGGQWGQPPTPDHKPGVALTVVLDGTDVRELRGNSKALTQFIAAIAREAASQGAKADGPIPLIRLETPKLIKIGQGSSVDVRYKMAPAAKWLARSVLHDGGAEPAPAPKAKQAPEPAPADDLEF